ncbi:hypothetical protein [uncultured Roseibium sp.]|uniref:DUF7940 domain-containing protein n=1 Tax=uncultured Roseibium sp. TaxID=1936171 RepID=UPI002619134F|nr:hypothetical protein [uncultured Roseibium sp.]
MKLIIGWRRVLARAWSVRLMLLAAVLSGAEVALPFLGDLLGPGRLALFSALATAGAFAARILVQKDMKDGT